ncbi:hypothetical protein [Methylobacter sp.]|uniref:hypothetical protein n=1 Tax=Methylobacter sp. TaxID=2051955 RepID=UPI002FDD6425
MIIKSSAIQLNSRHQFSKSFQESESLRSWKTPKQQLTDKVSLSSSAQTLKTDTQSVDLSKTLDANQGVKFLIVKHMVKAITGYEFKLFSPGEFAADTGATHVDIATRPPVNQAPSAGFGLVYEHHAVYQESETASFSATGSIKTQDGQSIDFSVKLNMSREFRIETNSSITAGDPEKKVDPLAINFDGNAAELSQTRFEFDLDANGTTEQIATLKPGSGFLALDKNQDGVINNGSELFGPNSGNGFSDLTKYDSDNNGFIDEADPIYKNLRIWQRHENGSQQLIALGDKNVGAIYLGHATTPFQLRSAANQSLGEITDSGIYLTEDGKTGTVQQINLSV